MAWGAAPPRGVQKAGVLCRAPLRPGDLRLPTASRGQETPPRCLWLWARRGPCLPGLPGGGPGDREASLWPTLPKPGQRGPRGSCAEGGRPLPLWVALGPLGRSDPVRTPPPGTAVSPAGKWVPLTLADAAWTCLMKTWSRKGAAGTGCTVPSGWGACLRPSETPSGRSLDRGNSTCAVELMAKKGKHRTLSVPRSGASVIQVLEKRKAGPPPRRRPHGAPPFWWPAEAQAQTPVFCITAGFRRTLRPLPYCPN